MSRVHKKTRIRGVGGSWKRTGGGQRKTGKWRPR